MVFLFAYLQMALHSDHLSQALTRNHVLFELLVEDLSQMDFVFQVTDLILDPFHQVPSHHQMDQILVS